MKREVTLIHSENHGLKDGDVVGFMGREHSVIKISESVIEVKPRDQTMSTLLITLRVFLVLAAICFAIVAGAGAANHIVGQTVFGVAMVVGMMICFATTIPAKD